MIPIKVSPSFFCFSKEILTLYKTKGRDITKYIVEGNLDKLFELTKATFVPVPMTSVRPNVDLANNPAYQLYTSRSLSSVAPRDPLIAQAIELVSEQRITDTVKHLSSYFSRQSYSVGGKAFFFPPPQNPY